MDFKGMIQNSPLLRKIANICLLVGGVDLGIFGLIGIDIITSILGNILGRLVFIVIGVAAGYLIYDMFMGGAKPKAPQQTPQPPHDSEDSGV